MKLLLVWAVGATFTLGFNASVRGDKSVISVGHPILFAAAYLMWPALLGNDLGHSIGGAK